MIVFGKCELCRKRRFFIRKRKYTMKDVGKLTSKANMCGRCFSKIKEVLKAEV